MQQSVPVPASTDTAQKAGFWIRVLAYIIDGIILYIISFVVGLVLGNSTTARGGVNLLLSLIYFSYFWSNSSVWPGRTVGMKLLNLRVVRTDGTDLTITQAFIRWIGLVISFLVIFIGVIWVAFDPNKQGWHDKIAGTYVVKTS